jgi:hypothetical protein
MLAKAGVSPDVAHARERSKGVSVVACDEKWGEWCAMGFSNRAWNSDKIASLREVDLCIVKGMR